MSVQDPGDRLEQYLAMRRIQQHADRAVADCEGAEDCPAPAILELDPGTPERDRAAKVCQRHAGPALWRVASEPVDVFVRRLLDAA